METVKGRSHVYVKVEPLSTFVFTRDPSYNASTAEPLYNGHLGDRHGKWPLAEVQLYFIYARKNYATVEVNPMTDTFGTGTKYSS